ncbi:MAG: alpha-2-macroglobulin, partial [Nitrospirales bacterium]|nr:alpha-2-macroglobulin [Nitrospirales bacterium]
MKAVEPRLHPSWQREEQKGKEEHILVLQCRQTFPPEAAVKILWGKGIRTLTGVETTEDQILGFRTREPFRAHLSCMKEREGADCIPLTPVVLSFTEPVTREMAGKVALKAADGKTWRPKKTDDETGSDLRRLVFDGPFPGQASLTLSIPKDLKDDSNRDLVNRDEFPMTVKTASYPPLAKFSSRFGIIELKEGSVLPVTVRNIEAEMQLWLKGFGEKGLREKTEELILDKAVKLGEALPDSAQAKAEAVVGGLKGRLQSLRIDQEEKIIQWLAQLSSAEREKPLLHAKESGSFRLPLPGGGKAFEVVGIPLKGAGFYITEIESPALGSRLLEKKTPMYVPAGALVTNMAAHFKWGSESSLVWVTTLDKGEPVKAADVTIRDCKGKEVWKGQTDSHGIALIKTGLPPEEKLPRCGSRVNYSEAAPGLVGIRQGLFIFARTKEDMTFTHSSWDDGIEPWRFNLPGDGGERQLGIARTILDRSLLRAGETVHMKHVMRKQTTTGFAFLSPADLPEEAVVEQIGSGQKYAFPIRWSGQATAETEWRIPETARLGTYQISLVKKAKAGKNEQERSWESGLFRVEEFRVPLMKASIQPPKEPLVRPKELDLDLLVTYLSGGGASNLLVKVRSEIQPKGISLPDYEGFVFSSGAVREGIIKRSEGEEEEEAAMERKRLQTLELSLDRAGAARVKIQGIPEIEGPKELLAEMEFRDPNGEVQTASGRIPLYPSQWLIGIRSDDWLVSKEGLRYTVAVADLKGRPVKDADVQVRLLQVKNYSHRRRVTGGFYAYEHIREVKALGDHCKGKTDGKGLLFCEGKAPASGSVVLQAEVKDPSGEKASTSIEVWAAGKEDLWFGVANDDRMDIIPEKKRYEPGETARLQVRMPFKEATALVTVEREGIMESFVRQISRNSPVIELPVKGNYAPNCFVSVLVVRGRMAEQRPTALFDPGKPAYKLGIAEIRVGWKAHELKVKVSTDRELYRVREKASAAIQVRTAFGTPPPKGTEVAVVAVDEGLLELMPNTSWRLLDEMMARRGCGVKTSTAQMMVVGKRHFGKKALPAGGGGGRQITRELFDTLLFWKGSVALNDKGEATVEIPLKDSLSSFRIVAVVVSGPGLFGTGQTFIRTGQDLMLLSGIPPVIREGDRFRAGFTVRNTTKREMTVLLDLAVKGVMKEKATESLKPGEAKEIGWDIAVPHGVSSLRYDLSAQEAKGSSRDSVSASQKVISPVPVRTFQATMLQLKDSLSIPVERPSDAIQGSGGVSVSLRPRLSEGLTGVTQYMETYPYTCMEQKVSRSVALRAKGMWDRIMTELPSHMDRDGLVKYFPPMPSGSDVLTSYLLSISNEAGYAIPDDLKDRMLEGLKGFVEG